jgi:predicted RNase H-like nuclease (RuvC/YqgF family)
MDPQETVKLQKFRTTISQLRREVTQLKCINQKLEASLHSKDTELSDAAKREKVLSDTVVDITIRYEQLYKQSTQSEPQSEPQSATMTVFENIPTSSWWPWAR